MCPIPLAWILPCAIVRWPINSVETNGESLVEYLRLVPGRRHLCLEEGTQSQWLSEILSPHVHELAVVWAEKRRGNKNDALDAAAYGHSQDMGVNNFLSHTGSNGSTPWDRMRAAGYQYSSAGENIAAGYSSPRSVMQAS